MTQFPHDQFAKNLLEVLLSVFGEVKTSFKIVSQIREIDVYFVRDLQRQPQKNSDLGLLARLAANSAVFEVFRNPVKLTEINSCTSKLNDLHAKIINEAQKTQPDSKTIDLPMLWILTPTISAEKLKSTHAIKGGEAWGKGIYLLSPNQNIGIVAIHQLPVNQETLWIRLLGRGRVQLKAIKQIAKLQIDSRYSQNVLELFSDLRLMLEIKQDIERDEQELIMQLSPLYLEKIQEAKAEANLALILKLLAKRLRVTELSQELQVKIKSLSITKLEQLGEALLDFQGMRDLTAWLSINVDT
jgi:hypothetical protein